MKNPITAEDWLNYDAGQVSYRERVPIEDAPEKDGTRESWDKNFWWKMGWLKYCSKEFRDRHLS